MVFEHLSKIVFNVFGESKMKFFQMLNQIMFPLQLFDVLLLSAVMQGLYSVNSYIECLAVSLNILEFLERLERLDSTVTRDCLILGGGLI